jgi:hypothetical protein
MQGQPTRTRTNAKTDNNKELAAASNNNAIFKEKLPFF